MVETAALPVDHVLPHRPVRQWVLSFPYPLHFLLASQPQAMAQTRNEPNTISWSTGSEQSVPTKQHRGLRRESISKMKWHSNVATEHLKRVISNRGHLLTLATSLGLCYGIYAVISVTILNSGLNHTDKRLGDGRVITKEQILCRNVYDSEHLASARQVQTLKRKTATIQKQVQKKAKR